MGNATEAVAATQAAPGLDVDALFDRIQKVQDTSNKLKEAKSEFATHVADLDLHARAHGIGTASGNYDTGQVTIHPGQVPQTPELQKQQAEADMARKTLELMDSYSGRQAQNGQPGGVVSSGPGAPPALSSATPPVAPGGVPVAGNVSRIQAGPVSIDQDTKLQQIARGTELRKELQNNELYKGYQEVVPQVKAADQVMSDIKSGKTKNLAVADQILIDTFNRVANPQAVVRQSAYERSTEGLSLMNEIKGKVAKIATGGSGLTMSDREAVLDGLKTIAEARGQTFNKLLDQVENQSDAMNVPRQFTTAGIERHKDLRPSAPPIIEGTVRRNKKTKERQVWKGGSWQAMKTGN